MGAEGERNRCRALRRTERLLFGEGHGAVRIVDRQYGALDEFIAEQPCGIGSLDPDPARLVHGAEDLVRQRESTQRNTLDLGESERLNLVAESAAGQCAFDGDAELLRGAGLQYVGGAGIEHE